MKRVANKNSIYFIFLLLLVAFMPFQSLLTSVLHSHTDLSGKAIFWLLHWYEPVMLLLLVFDFKKMLKLFENHQSAAFWTLILLSYGALNVIFFSRVKGLGVEGFRFTLIYAIAFLLANISDLPIDRKKKIINLYFVISSIFAMLAIAERLLPLHYWEIIGFTGPGFPFGYGYHRVVAIVQSTSIIGAPNQLGTYLIPAFFLSLTSKTAPMTYFISIRKYRDLELREDIGIRQQDSKTVNLLTCLLALAIILTFSRSAIIGLIVGLLVYLIYATRKKIYLLFVPIVVVGGWQIWQNAYNSGNRVIIDLFTHGASQESHVQALSGSLEEIGRRISQPPLLIFGSGLGTAGPIALKYGGTVSESWYLQLVLEMGLVGLVLWLFFIYKVIKEKIGAHQNCVNGLLLGLISVMMAAIFLHTFADNSAMSITLFTLLGLRYNIGKLETRISKQIKIVKNLKSL